MQHPVGAELLYSVNVSLALGGRIKSFCERGLGRAARPSQPGEARWMPSMQQAAACSREAVEIINTRQMSLVFY